MLGLEKREVISIRTPQLTSAVLLRLNKGADLLAWVSA
jgi:hypothetical protein